MEPPKPNKHHSRSSASGHAYRLRRDEEINKNIEQLKGKGIAFHYQRGQSQKQSQNPVRTSPNHKYSPAAPHKPILNWKLIFSLCCLTVMIYYAFILLF